LPICFLRGQLTGFDGRKSAKFYLNLELSAAKSKNFREYSDFLKENYPVLFDIYTATYILEFYNPYKEVVINSFN